MNRANSVASTAGRHTGAAPPAIDVEGLSKINRNRLRARVAIMMMGFCVVFGVIAARLVVLGLTPPAERISALHPQDAIAAVRPDILDRNGEMIATDVRTASLYAQPDRVYDIDETLEKLTGLLPDLDARALRARLAKKAKFVWVRRELTPRQQAAIHDLGLPGLGFLHESKRFYPTGSLLAHVLGHVDVDSHGIAGMEKAIDDAGLAALHDVGLARDATLSPVQLSIDVRVQHAVQSELARAMDEFGAIAATGIVLNAHTGEIVASSSLPGYDPHNPAQGLQAARLNRATAGVFELGSVFKIFNTAIALDSGRVSPGERFDTGTPIRVSRFTISDSHPRRRPLTVPEIFVYSSNVGSAKIALKTGIATQKAYFAKLGLTRRLDIELPERAAPLLPRRWDKLTSMTMAFGHGISVTPLQAATATAALVNGGYYINPSFRPRSEIAAKSVAVPVVSEHTSQVIRALMRLNVMAGTGRRARVPGYRVGGKTGTAEKVVNGRYSKTRKLNTFLSIFPAETPQFVLLVTIDEAKHGVGNSRTVTAGTTAAPATARIIKRIAPMLGIVPKFEPEPASLKTLLSRNNADEHTE